MLCLLLQVFCLSPVLNRVLDIPPLSCAGLHYKSIWNWIVCCDFEASFSAPVDYSRSLQKEMKDERSWGLIKLVLSQEAILLTFTNVSEKH